MKQVTEEMKQVTEVRIKVRSGDKVIETAIPWSERTATFRVGSDTSPTGVLDMVKEMVGQLNKIT